MATDRPIPPLTPIRDPHAVTLVLANALEAVRNAQVPVHLEVTAFAAAVDMCREVWPGRFPPHEVIHTYEPFEPAAPPEPRS